MDNIKFILLLLYWSSLGGGTWQASVNHSLSRVTRQSSCQNQFSCLNGMCIDKSDVCNGLSQCVDGSDETPDVCECGQVNAIARNSGNAAGVTDAFIELHPWHVGIFRSNLVIYHYKLICSGTLIYSDIVLTSANCIFDPETFQPYSASALLVGAGKLKKDYAIDEKTQQKAEVSKVIILDGFEGDPKKYAKNLAIIKLKNKLITSKYVRPLCLWTSRDMPRNIKKAVITGWGLQYTGSYAINLRQASVNLLDIKECSRRITSPQNKRYITYDKFCITFDEEVGLKDDDTGGSVTVYDGLRYYLLGVISINMSGSDFGLATKVSKHIDWIRKTTYDLKQNDRCIQGNHFNCITNGACVSSVKICDGKRDCSDGSDEDDVRCPLAPYKPPAQRPDSGSRKCEIPDGYENFKLTKCGDSSGCKSEYSAPSFSTYNITCPEGRGFSRVDMKSVEVVCNDGNWYPSIEDNRCLRLCPALSSKSLELKCFYQGKQVACSRDLNPDTKIVVECKKSYKKQPLVYFANETECKKDGTIKHDLTECVPVCGKPFVINAEVQISKGEKVKYAKYPWHVALYWRELEEDGEIDYNYKCGGTLIDSNKILTAGHCIWRRNSPVDADDLAVALGKVHSNWWFKDDLEQKIGVKKVIPGEHYNGIKTKHAQDIAVLILTKDVEFSDYTMPACLDLDSTSGGIPPNQAGHVVGWGSLEDGSKGSSDVLMEAWMDYLDLESCRKRFEKQGFDEYLYPDKICVLYRDGSGTQTGDSGGGYTFIHDNLHYIYGIVSIKKSGQDIFAAFTNVLSHAKWLKSILAGNY